MRFCYRVQNEDEDRQWDGYRSVHPSQSGVSKKDTSVLSVTVTAENRMASEVRSAYSRPFV